MFRRRLVLVLVMFCGVVFRPAEVSAQRFSLSTNTVDWAAFGTMNLEAGVSVARRITLETGFRYNPWTFATGDPMDRLDDPFGEDESQFQYRQQTYSLGLKFWPWHVYSGWWYSFRAQYQEYSRGGLLSTSVEEGDAGGLAFSMGYTRMLSNHWNVSFGAGVWGGTRRWVRYECPNCGYELAKGEGVFFLPDDLFIVFSFIF